LYRLGPSGSVEFLDLPEGIDSDAMAHVTTVHAAGDDDVWFVAWSREYKVASVGGVPRRGFLELDVQKEALSPDEQARIRALAEQLPYTDPDRHVPEFKSLLRNLRMSDGGLLWVQTTRGNGKNTIFDILHLDRGYLRSVSVPVQKLLDFEPIRSGLVALWFDELGVSYVSKYEVGDGWLN
jgi:hypothetical protein